MSCGYVLPSTMPSISQEEFRDMVNKNMPTDKKYLERINLILSNKGLIITEVAFAGKGVFNRGDGHKYKNRMRYKFIHGYFKYSEYEFLYNAPTRDKSTES